MFCTHTHTSSYISSSLYRFETQFCLFVLFATTVLFWLLCTYTEVSVLDIKHGTHVGKVVQVLVVQQDVDRDPPLVGRLHQVT